MENRDILNGIICSYRCRLTYFWGAVYIFLDIFFIWLFLQMPDFDITNLSCAIVIFGLVIVAGIPTGYIIMTILNKKVILAGDKIIYWNIIGKKAEFRISDITRITRVCRRKANGYNLCIRFGKSSIKLYDFAKGYEMFEKVLCNKLKVQKNSRFGKQILYDVNK